MARPGELFDNFSGAKGHSEVIGGVENFGEKMGLGVDNLIGRDWRGIVGTELEGAFALFDFLFESFKFVFFAKPECKKYKRRNDRGRFP